MRNLIFLLCLFSYSITRSATLFARADGDWDQVGTWSTIGPGGASCGCIPVAGDDVIIDGYDVVIDVNTGSVTVNSLILRSDTRGDNALLRVEDGMRLTVTNNLTIFANRANRIQTLNIINNNTRVVIGGDLILDQNTGDDMIIDIEDSGRLDVGDDVLADKDGGDDIDFRLNENSGTTATIVITDDFSLTVDNFNSNGIRFYLNGTSCLFNVGGDFSYSANTATSDVGITLFDLNAGLFDVDGSMSLTRADDCGNIDFDMDGGLLSANSVTINSSGTLFGNTGVRFFVDQNSQVNIATNMVVNMTGADDFFINVNENVGTTAQFNVGGNLTFTRSAGDDIELRANADNSRIDVNGNLTITSSGGENIIFDLNNDAVIDIAGNFSINQTGGDICSFILEGGGDNPLLNVGGNCTLTNGGGADDFSIDMDGGTFAVAGNCNFNLNTGGDDFLVFYDGNGVMTVGGDFVCTLAGGDDFSFGLGENTVASTARVDVAGHMQLVHNTNAAGALFYLRVYDNTEVEAGQLTLTTNFATAPAFLVDVNNSAILDVDGNINLNAPASGELELRVSATSTVQLMGNIVRAAVPNKFGEVDFSATGTLLLNGSSPQVIASDAGSGADFVSYYNVILNNTSGTNPQFTMEGLATIRNNINFIDGVVATTSTNILVINDNVTATSASDASYVDGPVRKVGNDVFAFPVGDDNNYQPIYITAPGVTTDAFEAQYLETDPDPLFDDASKAVGIDHVSSCEYWLLNRTAGTSNVSVTLTWDPNSCGVTNLATLLVTRWNATQWTNQGNGGTGGTVTTGTIISSGLVTSFSPFTLGSSTSANPLPIQLLEFNAVPVGSQVMLRWTTLQEKNNRYFEVEKSKSGFEWYTVGKLNGADNSSGRQDYELLDSFPFSDLSYYRLKQVDHDGSFSYSPIVSVQFQNQSFLSIYPNPAGEFLILKGTGLKSENILLYNALGQPVRANMREHHEGLLILTDELASGMYLITIRERESYTGFKVLINKN